MFNRRIFKGQHVPGNFNTCDPDRPVPVLAFNSVNDPVTDYYGFQSVTAIEEVMALWQGFNNCDPEPTETPVTNSVQNDGSTVNQIKYENCDDVELILMKMFNAGHTWPGANPFALLGNTNMDINATKDSWEFFKRYAIPEELICDEPLGLNEEVLEQSVLFSWDPVPGIDFYNLFATLPNGEIIYIEDISGTSHELSLQGEGELSWAVRAQCNSGHVSWSDIRSLDVAFRLASSGFQVYPNPVRSTLRIKHNKSIDKEETFVITDVYGTIVMRGIVQEKVDLDVSNLPKGWYSIRNVDGQEHRNFFKN